ncbi:unnamed protein product [Heligmosomoides polygyrus]|uniref:PITH domain-containing protein n=1 Tax=Heligmosomoides polygyrus TaxID=6339 RepID=A0A183FFV2_HELPZ|nr:unnamed protein product [Heligmosomoides polygyrus]
MKIVCLLKLRCSPVFRRLSLHSRTDFVESDCDEELLFNIPFTGQVRISGLSVIGDEDESHPARIRLFKDRPVMSFDDCSIEADQEIDLKQDPCGVVDYPLKAAKFGTLSHLSIHVQRNFGAEQTRINYIGLRGEYQADFRQQVQYIDFVQENNKQ